MPIENMNNSKESLEDKLNRIHSSVRDALNTVWGYMFIIRKSKSDEEMHKLLNEDLAEHPVMPYMDYIKGSFPKTTQEEITYFFPEFKMKISKFTERLQSSDATKEELMALYDDLSDSTRK